MKDIEAVKGEIVMYQPDETIRLEVRMSDETVWLSANQMASLFDRDEKTIRKHINNVFSDEEVLKGNNTQFLRVDGVTPPTQKSFALAGKCDNVIWLDHYKARFVQSMLPDEVTLPNGHKLQRPANWV